MGLRRCLDLGLSALSLLALGSLPIKADAPPEQPAGVPLAISSTETEQPVPILVVSPDGQKVSCVQISLHWFGFGKVENGAGVTFDLDLPDTAPGGAIFAAQLWNASLSSAAAWQLPWTGAHWKVSDVPPSDGSGYTAALAVGLIATSARRPYPIDTVVIGTLNPDGSLGPVARMRDRIEAAADAHLHRVILPSCQLREREADGTIEDFQQQASDLHLECVAVPDLVTATEKVMGDPLPTLAPIAPIALSPAVISYISDCARQEQAETESNLAFTPAPENSADPRTPTWKAIQEEKAAAEKALQARQDYAAYRLFQEADGTVHGLNALLGETSASFDLKGSLAAADSLLQQIHDLLNPCPLDHAEIQSALVEAELADWLNDLRASLEGAELVTKQSFSPRSDASNLEKERARQAMLMALGKVRCLLPKASFFETLLARLPPKPLPVEANAALLLPQLLPAQLATAEVFADEIRPRASQLRSGLLFDARLVAYLQGLRETKSAWELWQHQRELAQAAAGDTAAPTLPAGAPPTVSGSTHPDTFVEINKVAFDPGNTYAQPRLALGSSGASLSQSSVAQCLLAANQSCEIARLTCKYLRLDGAISPGNNEWQAHNSSRLNTLLDLAQAGAQRGLALAAQGQIDPTLLDLIHQRASALALLPNSNDRLEALAQDWRCALLGNLCWQMVQTRKAQPVNLSKLELDPAQEPNSPVVNQTKTALDSAPGAKPDASAPDPVHPPGPIDVPVPSPAPPRAQLADLPAIPPSPSTSPSPSPQAPPGALAPPASTNQEASPPAPPASGPVVLPTSPAPAPTIGPVPPPIDATQIPTAKIANPLDLQTPGPTTNAPTDPPVAPPATNP